MGQSTAPRRTSAPVWSRSTSMKLKAQPIDARNALLVLLRRLEKSIEVESDEVRRAAWEKPEALNMV